LEIQFLTHYATTTMLNIGGATNVQLAMQKNNLFLTSFSNNLIAWQIYFWQFPGIFGFSWQLAKQNTYEKVS